MKALFRREVPEIDDGIVTIMGVARDPGLRAKVAVISHEPDVDPVGACVGVKGSRIQNIVQEFRGERIDIVLWNPDITTYAANALSPAVITRITVDDDDKTLEVVVPDDQLTPAIGRKGQNVKLAAKLLGWRIDIFTESRYGELNKNRRGLEQLASAAEIHVENLLEAGFEDVNSVVASTEAELLDIEGIGEENVADLKAAANLLAEKAPENEEPEDAQTGEEAEPDNDQQS
jgi:N utilization substance protein A